MGVGNPSIGEVNWMTVRPEAEMEKMVLPVPSMARALTTFTTFCGVRIGSGVA